MNQVIDENLLSSARVNSERYFTDGKLLFIEREHSVLEYLGPLNEASADVIASFLQCEDCMESEYECRCEKPGETPVGTY